MPKILLIDDDRDFCRMVSEFLRRHDYEVIVATNGSEGLAAATSLPDLVLCDVDMPGINGLGVLTVLRRDSTLADTPFIFISACTNRITIRQSMNLGGDDFITKPTDLLEILDAVHARLARHERQRQRVAQRVNQGVRQFMSMTNALAEPLPGAGGHPPGGFLPAIPDLRETLEKATFPTSPPAGQLAPGSSVLVKERGRLEYLPLNKVKAIIANGEYSIILWGENRRFMLRKALRLWARELPPTQFVQIHRAAIINLAFLDHVERQDNGTQHVCLQGLTDRFPVSQRARAGFNRLLKQFQPLSRN